MKNEPKVKKLILKKETLRDLTAHNAGQVKGGSVGGYCSWTCIQTCGCVSNLGTCKCHGKTYNKHCGY